MKCHQRHGCETTQIMCFGLCLSILVYLVGSVCNPRVFYLDYPLRLVSSNRNKPVLSNIGYAGYRWQAGFFLSTMAMAAPFVGRYCQIFDSLPWSAICHCQH